MKTLKGIIIALLTICFFSACKNVNKLVEQGRYNEAIEYAVKKMAGEENKKVEHVKALEKSFNRLNQSQMNEIEVLAERGGRDNWSRVIRLSNEIIQRQTLVAPLTPLKAENGYTAKLNFADATIWRQKAIDQFLELSWQDYHHYIENGRKGDKFAARKAFYLLEEIGFYEDRSSIKNELEEAKRLGTTYVLMKVVQHEQARLNESDIKLIREFFNAEPVREIWSEIHIHPQNDINYDYLSEIAIHEIQVSPEVNDQTLERVSREVQTGEKAMRDEKGKVVVDSTGEVIMVPIYETARGEIIRIRQFKDANILAEIRIIRKGEYQPLSSTKKTTSAEFNNAFQDWRGDKRAFDGPPQRGRPVSFPPDEVLIQECVDILQEFAMDYTVDWTEKLAH